MLIKWEFDNDVVELEYGGFRKVELRLNGQPIATSLSVRKKNEFSFALDGSRSAKILITPQFGGSPAIGLRVGDALMVPTPKKPLQCSKCGTDIRPNDRFCSNCGQAAPAPETYLHQKNLKEATTVIWVLAALFVFSGVVMFFVTQSQSSAALAKLSSLDASTVFPHLINGKSYTVGALRAEIEWEPWGALIVNLVIAAIMAALAFWSNWSPLAAIMVAAATYAVLVVYNAITNPESLAQGVYIKIIVVFLMYRGIKAALALRSANA